MARPEETQIITEYICKYKKIVAERAVMMEIAEKYGIF